MSRLNRYSFIGNLGMDAEVRQLDGSTRCVISFSVAVTEKWKTAQGTDQDKTTWVRCSLWREQGKTKIADYLKKGQMVYVEGKPDAREYVDTQGKAKASLEVTVFDVQLIGGSGAAQQPAQNSTTFGGTSMNNGNVSRPAAQQPPANNLTPQDDDLPF